MIADLPDFLRKVTAWDVAVILGGFLVSVAPGFLILFMFRPDLMQQMESFKLVVLSASFTLPLVAFNAFALAGVGQFIGALGDEKQGPPRKHVFFWLTTWTFLALYIAVAAEAFLWDLSPGGFLLLVIAEMPCWRFPY